MLSAKFGFFPDLQFRFNKMSKLYYFWGNHVFYELKLKAE